MAPCRNAIGSVYDLKTVFLDDRIGQHVFGNPFQLLLRFLAVPAIEIQDEEFSLAHISHRRVPEPRKGMMDRLSLGIEDRAFWHDPNVCFHAVSITLPDAASWCLTFGSRVKGVVEARFANLLELALLQAHLSGSVVFITQSRIK